MDNPNQTEQQPTQVNLQVEFTVMQIKMNLLALAKDMVKDKLIIDSVFNVYLDLRHEVLGIPNPNNTNLNGKKD